MKHFPDKNYYVSHKPELLKQYDAEAKIWSPIVHGRYGEIQGYKILQAARLRFEKLLPRIPDIGGKANVYIKNFIESVMYLALYQVMKENDYPVDEAGRILYEIGLVKYSRMVIIPPRTKLTPEQIMERRQKTAALSRERRYPADYVFSFVKGTGKNYDYGFNFTECATQKLYKAHGADEFLPYYCYLDFVSAKVRGFKFTRTQNLYEGHDKCNHRFKAGGITRAEWPPPFLKRK
jgi:hypothetical protein